MSPQMQVLQQQYGQALTPPQMSGMDPQKLLKFAATQGYADALSRGLGGGGVSNQLPNIMSIAGVTRDNMIEDWKIQLASKKAALENQFGLEESALKRATEELRQGEIKQSTKTEEQRTRGTKATADKSELELQYEQIFGMPMAQQKFQKSVNENFTEQARAKAINQGIEQEGELHPLRKRKAEAEATIEEDKANSDLLAQTWASGWIAKKGGMDAIDPSDPKDVAAMNLLTRSSVMHVDNEPFPKRLARTNPKFAILTKNGTDFPDPLIEPDKYEDVLFMLKNESPGKPDIMKVIDQTVLDIIHEMPARESWLPFTRKEKDYLVKAFIDLVGEPEILRQVQQSTFFKETLKDVAEKAEVEPDYLERLLEKKTVEKQPRREPFKKTNFKNPKDSLKQSAFLTLDAPSGLIE